MCRSSTVDEDSCDYVDEDEIRRIFNELAFFERAEGGEFDIEKKSSDHLSARNCQRKGEPYCTWSQYLWYRDKRTGIAVAGVHQYLRPDGSIGAGGKPDPKYLRHKGRILKVLAPDTRRS